MENEIMTHKRALEIILKLAELADSGKYSNIKKAGRIAARSLREFNCTCSTLYNRE